MICCLAGLCLLSLLCLLCLQDESLIWAQRALQALKGIASHPVSFDFARAAAAPVASRQLAQAWQAFKAAIARDASPPNDVCTAAQAVDVSSAGACSAATAAVAGADVNMSRGMALPEVGTAAKQIDPSDEADDEEVCVFLPPANTLNDISAPHGLPFGVKLTTLFYAKEATSLFV